MNFDRWILGVTLVCASVAFAAGSISGTVGFSGSPPKQEKLNRRSDPVCAKKEMMDESLLLSSNGKAIQNVVVRITHNAPAGAGAPSEPVVIDQLECMYRPRVSAAVQGQKILIKNSDNTLHNVHSYLGKKTVFNQAQPPSAKPIEKEAKGNMDVLKLKCDVHPWMTGWVVVSPHPYFAVTGADGKFEIKNVPPGKYTVEAWHEALGTQSSEVTVVDGKPADPKLSFGNKKS